MQAPGVLVNQGVLEEEQEEPKVLRTQWRTARNEPSKSADELRGGGGGGGRGTDHVNTSIGTQNISHY